MKSLNFFIIIPLLSTAILCMLGCASPAKTTSKPIKIATKIAGLAFILFAIFGTYSELMPILEKLNKIESLGPIDDNFTNHKNMIIGQIIASGFIFFSFGCYFLNFKISDTPIWKKIFKIIGAVLYYFCYCALINIFNNISPEYLGITVLIGLLSGIFYGIGYHKSKAQHLTETEKTVDLSSNETTKVQKTEAENTHNVIEQKALSSPQKEVTPNPVEKPTIALEKLITNPQPVVPSPAPQPVTPRPLQVAPASQIVLKMYCKHCGKKIDADSQFCVYCGGKL